MFKTAKIFKDYFQHNYFILFLIFTLCIKGIAFSLIVNNSIYFSSFIRMCFFSLLLLFVLTLPFTYQKRRKYFKTYLIINTVLTTILIVDLTYFSYFDSIPTVSLIGSSGQLIDVLPAVLELLSPFYVLFFVDIFLALFLNKKYRSRFECFNREILSKGRVAYLNSLLLALAFFIMCILFYVDWNKFFVSAFNGAVSNDKIIVNKYGVYASHVFDAFRVLTQNTKNITPEEKEKLVEWINKNKFVQVNNEYTGIAKNKNIILIQVESLQSFVLNSTVNGQEITPNLNKLLQESHCFENNYFQIGGGNSSDADFVVNTSLYPQKYEVVFNKYNQMNYTSLPKSLGEAGYSSYAYHANTRDFYNRDITYNSFGYDRYFAADSYKGNEIIDMGLNDEDFLIQTADYIKEQPKPSFSYLITLSSHYPFKIDKKYRFLDIPNYKNEMVSGYLQSIRYADNALGVFFDRLRELGLYDESLIIVYGDHNATINSFKLDNRKVDTNTIEGKKTPLIIRMPDQKKGLAHSTVSSNIDIMPTILNLIGVKTSAPMFGTDLFSGIENKFYAVKSLDIGSIVTDSFYVSVGENGRNTCHNYDGSEADPDKKIDCEREIERKEIIQAAVSKLIYYNLFEEL